MLGLMIHAHPRRAMPPETRFVIECWRRREEWGDLSTWRLRRALGDAIVGAGRDPTNFRDLQLRRWATRHRIVQEARTLGSAFGIAFEEFAKAHGKARWGDKRPAYFEEVDVLLRLFPDAQIVHILRDGRATVASLKRMPWWPVPSTASMATWALSEWCLRRDSARLPPDTFHSLRYEDLVRDPRAELTRLCDFLGEEFDEAMLEPHKVRDVVPERKTWHKNLDSSVNPSAVDAWRRRLEPWEIGLMESALGRALTRHGYELSGLGTRPPLGKRAVYHASFHRQRIAAVTRWRREEKQSRTSGVPVAAQLTSAQRALAGP
jgi:hypothetical protein